MQGALPEKEEEAERVARQATTYCIQDGELYRKRPNDVSYVESLGNRGRSCWLTYTMEIADTTRRHGPSSGRRFTVGSTSLRHSTTRQSW